MSQIGITNSLALAATTEKLDLHGELELVILSLARAVADDRV
jgi:hypothetical protein